MIHEIGPERLDNQYREKQPDPESRICLIRSGSMLLKKVGNQVTWPRYGNVSGRIGKTVYLFSIGEDSWFLAEPKPEAGNEDNANLNDPGEMEWIPWMQLRDVHPVRDALAAMTAIHLWQWYSSAQYCGRCGGRTVHDHVERMMYCPSCGNRIYPRIAPAIIVAVIHEGKILLTKYAGRPASQQYALVAGFVEIGETAEECVQRELMEEVGLRVKNIRYYGSQPWGFAGNLMMGFTAELDGAEEIHLDRQELGLAEWLTPEEIPEIEDYSSLTREIIRRFKHGVL